VIQHDSEIVVDDLRCLAKLTRNFGLFANDEALVGIAEQMEELIEGRFDRVKCEISIKGLEEILAARRRFTGK
jgi:hypothetical protein